MILPSRIKEFNPGFPRYPMIKEQYFDSIELMEAIQASFAVLIWRTQWVKHARTL